MFRFYESCDAPAETGDADLHVALVPAGLRSTRELLAAVGEALAFPWYYGVNFDAFWDCVRTLDGIEARRVALVHRDLPALPGGDLTVYFELLRDAVLYWDNPTASHRFEVWFPKALEAEVRAGLDACPPPADV